MSEDELKHILGSSTRFELGIMGNQKLQYFGGNFLYEMIDQVYAVCSLIAKDGKVSVEEVISKSQGAIKAKYMKKDLIEFCLNHIADPNNNCFILNQEKIKKSIGVATLIKVVNSQQEERDLMSNLAEACSLSMFIEELQNHSAFFGQ